MYWRDEIILRSEANPENVFALLHFIPGKNETLGRVLFVEMRYLSIVRLWQPRERERERKRERESVCLIVQQVLYLEREAENETL